VSVSGFALPEVVAWVTRLHAGQLQACYDEGLGRNPFLEGTWSFGFTVTRAGSVSAARATDPRHADATLDACLRRVASAMIFGQPEGGEVDVSWSLELSRTRGAHLVGLPSISQH
jgi:hypothetical protein